MTEITPDNYMDRPIESLLRGASMLVHRVMRMVDLPLETLNDPAAQKIMDVDEQMRVAYLAAIRLRAKEVCDYAASRGYRCVPDTVKNEPFAVCFVLFPPPIEYEPSIEHLHDASVKPVDLVFLAMDLHQAVKSEHQMPYDDQLDAAKKLREKMQQFDQQSDFDIAVTLMVDEALAAWDAWRKERGLR